MELLKELFNGFAIEALRHAVEENRLSDRIRGGGYRCLRYNCLELLDRKPLV